MVELLAATVLGIIGATVGAILGGIIYRMRGGMEPSLDHVVEHSLWSTIVCAACIALVAFNFSWVSLGVVAAGFMACFGATTVGHGDGIDFGFSPKRDETEWPNIILHRIPGLPKDGYLHDFLFMLLNGGSITAGPALVLVYFGWFYAAIALLVAGMMKSVAYLIGWLVHDYWPEYAEKYEPHIEEFGEGAFHAGSGLGEWFTGLFIGATSFVILALVLI